MQRMNQRSASYAGNNQGIQASQHYKGVILDCPKEPQFSRHSPLASESFSQFSTRCWECFHTLRSSTHVKGEIISKYENVGLSATVLGEAD